MLSGSVMPPSTDTLHGLGGDLPLAVSGEKSIAARLQKLTQLSVNINAMSLKKIIQCDLYIKQIKIVIILFVSWKLPQNYTHTLVQIVFPLTVRGSEPRRGTHTWLHSSSMCFCPSAMTARH